MKRYLLLSLLALAVLLAGGYGAYRGYKSLREARLLKQARAYIAKSEPKKAMLCLQGVLRRNSNNVEACRMMADLLERGQSPAALLWRSRVVDLDPTSTPDRLALAQTALGARDYASATNALEGVSVEGKKTAGYHNVAGAVSIAARDPDEAEAHFIEAARLEPHNLAPKLNLSVIRLQRTNEQNLAEARATLKSISANATNGALRCQALRELALDAVRHKNPDAALALSRQLLSDTNSLFRDRLLRLDILRATTNSEYSSAMAAFQREAGTNSAKIYELASWHIARGLPGEALAWLRSLPLTIQTNNPVALVQADCCNLTKDYRALHTFLHKQAWGDLDFVRHAFLSHSLRGQGLIDSAKAEWGQALKAANYQKAQLVMLLRLAAQWRLTAEAEDILATIVNRYPAERWAFQSLAQVLYLTGRTKPLMTLCEQQAKRFPADLGTKNNLAMTAMLLDANDLKPHDVAHELYQKAGTNSSFASTYAFSLHLQKKNAEALQIMEKLPAKALETPSIAAYYALVLQASGNREKAKPYFDLASKATFLPEEKKLIDSARNL